jgi:hypothetical protein
LLGEYNFSSQESDIVDFDGKTEKTNGIFNHQIGASKCSKLFIVSKTDDSKKLKAIKFDSNQLNTFVLDDGNQLKSDNQFIQVSRVIPLHHIILLMFIFILYVIQQHNVVLGAYQLDSS